MIKIYLRADPDQGQKDKLSENSTSINATGVLVLIPAQ